MYAFILVISPEALVMETNLRPRHPVHQVWVAAFAARLVAGFPAPPHRRENTPVSVHTALPSNK